MSLKTFKVTMGILGGILCLFAVAIAVIGLRSEDTRNVVEKIDSSCARAHDRTLPRHARRIATAECARNVCFALRDVMTRDAYEQVTRCPRKGVMLRNSPTASQSPGPGEGPDRNAPGVPDDPPVTDRPNPPDPGPSPPKPSPDPPKPSPAPTPPAPSSDPSINVTAPGVEIGIGNGGVCAGVGRIGVGLGDC